MGFFNRIRQYVDNNPTLKPFLLMWLRKTTKTINLWPEEKFIKGVMDCYQRRLGYTFDLQNPKTFNEKLQWYKIYYRRDDFGKITDKVLFKSYISERLGDGYTIPMYGYWENIKDLKRDWDCLPEKFVLKSNLMANASGVIIINKKSETDFKQIKKQVRRWLNPWNTLLNSWDWHFYNSTPKILAEKYMEDESGELRDYKFFCFNGHVPYFKVDYGRMNVHHANYYDSNFQELEMSVPGETKDKSVQIVFPSNIRQMYELAKNLSVGFPFIRIDFFSCNNKLYVSEFTFAPGGGVINYPYDFNKVLGDLFTLPQYEKLD